jgi:UDP-glucose 4-epimerase
VTSTAVTWVVGSSGLLGQHVKASVGEVFPARAVPWDDPEAAKAVLRQGFHELLLRAGSGPWNVAWCAGAGVVATSSEQLAAERSVFRGFLDDVADRISSTSRTGEGSAGALFFASSAGGVFADSTQPPFTEDSEPRPRTPYGVTKLSMEADLRSFAAATGTPALVGRIANLYGPGQNLAKPQGLVSQICRSHLTGQPLLLYVPLDTMRDYIYVKDCAAVIAAGLVGLRSRVVLGADGPVITKVIASGQATTIGGLLAESARIFRRRPRVALGSSPAAWGQVHDLRLRSSVWTELDQLVRTALPVGLAATAQDVGQRLREARL